MTSEESTPSVMAQDSERSNMKSNTSEENPTQLGQPKALGGQLSAPEGASTPSVSSSSSHNVPARDGVRPKQAPSPEAADGQHPNAAESACTQRSDDRLEAVLTTQENSNRHGAGPES